MNIIWCYNYVGGNMYQLKELELRLYCELELIVPMLEGENI
jgi:hypothetical protein